MDKNMNIKSCLEMFSSDENRFKTFSKQIEIFFKENKALNINPLPAVHSLKSRVKDISHLEEKLNRKWDSGDKITKENFYERINDLAGVRVLHLYQDQFLTIHKEIMDNIHVYKEWVLFETPKAYIWDKEKEQLYKDQGIDVETKESNYTSIHYVIKPNSESFISCEIQVRTLFEEIWGEIDHTINYPTLTQSIACREQLKVLAKFINAGTRLSDSIFASHNEFKENSKIKKDQNL